MQRSNEEAPTSDRAGGEDKGARVGQSQEQGNSQGSQKSSGGSQRVKHGVVLCGESGARRGHPGDDDRHASAPGESPSAQPQQRRTGADDGDADASEHCAGEPRTVDEQVLSKKNRVKLLKNVNTWCSEYSSCSVDCACEEPTGGTHDIFVVNLQSKPDFAKVFSNPRLLPAAERKGLKGLRSYDIGQGWNFLQADQRKACLDEIRHYNISPTVCWYAHRVDRSPLCKHAAGISKIRLIKKEN